MTTPPVGGSADGGVRFCSGFPTADRRSFSLIEVLVVIAIIAILAALLLPMLAAAREQGYAVQCLGNQRQLAMAHTMYGDEWKCTPPVNLGGQRWMERLSVYCGADMADVLVCPGDRRPVETGSVYAGDGGRLSFGLNQCYPAQRRSGDGRPLLWYGVPVSQIRNPAQFIVMADAGTYYIGTSVSMPQWGFLEPDKGGEYGVTAGFCKYLVFRHGSTQYRFNAAFADGHAAALSFGAVPTACWDYSGQGYGDAQP